MGNTHIREYIDEYLEGAMDAAGRGRFESHLSQCGSCRAALEDARDAISIMSWLPNPEVAPQPGPDFYYRVQASIENAQSGTWLTGWTVGLQPRLAIPILMMGMLLLAWMISLPRHGSAMNPDGWEEVEYPSADFAQMTYFDDQDETRHDRMMNNLFETAEAQ
jgi:hypothetical protein